MTAGLNRRIGRDRPIITDNPCHTRRDRCPAKNQNKRGNGDAGDVRVHGSCNPHELHAPVCRIKAVAGQRFSHPFANKNQA